MAERLGPDVPRLDGGWPLTGRDSELRSIAAALIEPGGVLLAGAAGVGKTRLAREALATHAHRVYPVLATESASRVPLGVFAPLLGTFPDGAGAALSAAHAVLRGGRSLLAVDDAHVLDDVSATLLHQLAVDQECRMVATSADLDGVLAALADPTFAFVDSLNIAAWGRRPAPAFLG